MKRFLCTILLCSLLFGLCACGSGEQKQTEKTPETTQMKIDQDDPAGDDTMNVLFISNSTSWYFMDELYGMLAAAGHKEFNLCHLYYSGCSLKQHVDFMKGAEKPYQFKVTNKNGVNITKDMDLETAMGTRNWDYIVTHNNAYSYRSENGETAYTETEPYLKELLNFVREKFPLSKYLWTNTWVPNVGYSLSFKMTSVDQRKRVQEANDQVSQFVKRDFGLDVVPCGKAWSKVRDLEILNTVPAGLDVEKFTMFTMIINGKISDDSVHDGDIGGGQYLNACVWFEVLTGESCIGNTFRPKYTYQAWDWSLSEEKIDILQKAAHEAVEENKK
ncbi:MAG: DUF4886 domain-containing protein [Oscillospiraceae bacterium]|nr:DUF4886 domain-containing protein [Oscillospiraceae bacterium]